MKNKAIFHLLTQLRLLVSVKRPGCQILLSLHTKTFQICDLHVNNIKYHTSVSKLNIKLSSGSNSTLVHTLPTCCQRFPLNFNSKQGKSPPGTSHIRYLCNLYFVFMLRSISINHIDSIWNHVSKFHQMRGQTYWLFHLKTDNLEVIQPTNTIRRSTTVFIHSMHFVFPFCSINVGSVIIIPISNNTWETEATLFSDFSSFLPLRVNYDRDEYSFSIRNPELILWDFFNTNNAGLMDDQKVMTRDNYNNVDKAIRHTMSTISSADGQWEGRKLNE